jgi:sec-independent protein translocase protein TatB
MLSFVDMGVVGVVALLVFGPDQLPKVARRAGQIMRDVQNTSQSFIREMERAADEQDVAAISSEVTTHTETVTHSDVNPYADPVPAADSALYPATTPTGYEASAPVMTDAIVSADGPLTAAPAYHAAPMPEPVYKPYPPVARVAAASETGEPTP